MRTFIIVMWILNLQTLEGHKQEWKGDLQSCLHAAIEFNDNPAYKNSYVGCYPESKRPPYIPERKKEDL